MLFYELCYLIDESGTFALSLHIMLDRQLRNTMLNMRTYLGAGALTYIILARVPGFARGYSGQYNISKQPNF